MKKLIDQKNIIFLHLCKFQFDVSKITPDSAAVSHITLNNIQ